MAIGESSIREELDENPERVTSGATTRNVREWDRLYGETKESVWGDVPVGFLEHFLEHVGARLTSESLILDAGCGEGRNLESLGRLSGRLVACDSSLHGLARASTSSRAHRLVRCAVEELPVPNGQVDFVLASDIFETLPDLKRPLAEIHRVLRAGGFLLANIPDLDDAIAGIDMRRTGTREYLYRDRFYFRFMEVAKARTVVENSGFSIWRQERCSWEEAPHPGFREEPHQHTSWVFLAQKNQPDLR